MATNLEVHGLHELFRKLDGLEPKLKKKVLRDALTKGANVTLAAAKANAPGGGAGLLGSKLMVRNIPKLRRGEVGVMVAFRNSKKLLYTTKAEHTYFIPAAIEFGHVAPYVREAEIARLAAIGRKRSHKANPRDIKVAAPHPFLRPAYDTTRDKARDVIAGEVRAFIRQENGG